MAKLFLTSVDLNKNQLLNGVVQVLATDPSSPVEGQIYFNSASKKLRTYDGSSWSEYAVGGSTNLSFSRDGTTVTIESDTGTNAVIPVASAALAGVMSASDKSKLDGIQSGAEANAVDSVNGKTGAAVIDPDDLDDSATVNKFVSAADKTKLSNIEANADVTDAANVNAAGAVMNSDSTLAAAAFFLDDDTMSANDATKAVSQQSLVAYVGAEIASALTGGMAFKGSYNASTNSPNLDAASPVAIKAGDTYVVSAAGNFFAESVQVGDMVVAQVDSASSLSDWVVVNKNIPDIVAASTTAQGIIEIATQTEVNNGSDSSRAVTPATLQSKLGVTANLNNVVRYTEEIGDGSATSIAVTHDIGRQFVTTKVVQSGSPFAEVECDVEHTSSTVTTFKFNSAPASNEYTVVITG